MSWKENKDSVAPGHAGMVSGWEGAHRIGQVTSAAGSWLQLAFAGEEPGPPALFVKLQGTGCSGSLDRGKGYLCVWVGKKNWDKKNFEKNG